MKAVIFQSNVQPLQIKEVDIPSPKQGEVLIQLYYASLNHLDLWILKEQSLPDPVILGSDGSGIVMAVGNNVRNDLVGKKVMINPSLYWGTNENMYGKNYQILGNPTNGTFAEYIVISQDYVYEIPNHLSLKEAAALPMAALTAYRALFSKAQATHTDKVLITGIGGGAALYLLQMTLAIGASVYITSSSDEKIKKAIELGAKGGINYKEQDWKEKLLQLAGGFDIIIDSAGGNNFAGLTEVANDAAKIILFGRTAGNINNLNPGIIYNKQLQIMGTVMGNSKEFGEMIAFYERHQLHPIVDKEFSLDEVMSALNYIDQAKHFGKVILKIK